MLKGARGGVLQAQWPPEVISSHSKSLKAAQFSWRATGFGKQSILEI